MVDAFTVLKGAAVEPRKDMDHPNLLRQLVPVIIPSEETVGYSLKPPYRYIRRAASPAGYHTSSLERGPGDISSLGPQRDHDSSFSSSSPYFLVHEPDGCANEHSIGKTMSYGTDDVRSRGRNQSFVLEATYSLRPGSTSSHSRHPDPMIYGIYHLSCMASYKQVDVLGPKSRHLPKAHNGPSALSSMPSLCC